MQFLLKTPQKTTIINHRSFENAKKSVIKMLKKEKLQSAVIENVFGDKFKVEIEVPTKHFNTGNQYAKKADTKKSDIHIRCRSSDKDLMIRNLKDGENLSDFIMTLALDQANKRESKKL